MRNPTIRDSFNQRYHYSSIKLFINELIYDAHNFIYLLFSVNFSSCFLFLYCAEEYDELGRLQRTCNGEVQVNKCEGLCNSQVQPSVITPTGFLKECYCCRESYLHERVVTLTHCYDPDGTRLSAPELATMDIRLKEPAECRCFKCGDFSR